MLSESDFAVSLLLAFSGSCCELLLGLEPVPKAEASGSERFHQTAKRSVIMKILFDILLLSRSSSRFFIIAAKET
jgi:hypothetical protein